MLFAVEQVEKEIRVTAMTFLSKMWFLNEAAGNLRDVMVVRGRKVDVLQFFPSIIYKVKRDLGSWSAHGTRLGPPTVKKLRCGFWMG